MFGLKNTKANRLEVRKAYIPNNSIETNYPELDTVVYTYSDSKKFYAMAFNGTAGKPSFHYSFSTEARMTAHVEKFLTGRKQTTDYKAEQKEKNKGSLTGSAATAKAIREHLKKEFPGIKFSVTSDNYSGGDSVRIHWTDGPVSKVVELITDQYQSGSFDGMTDMYNYSKIDPSLGCPGSKYVFAERTQSDERKAELEAHCMGKFGRIVEQYADWNHFNAWKYENSERDTWESKYREMLEAQERKQYEVYEADRQTYLAELKAREEQEARLQAEKASSKVIYLADHKKAKESKQKDLEDKEAQEQAEYITATVSAMTNAEIADSVHRVYASDNMDNEQKLVTIRHFLAILAEKDRPFAIRLFKEIDLNSLAK